MKIILDRLGKVCVLDSLAIDNAELCLNAAPTRGPLGNSC